LPHGILIPASGLDCFGFFIGRNIHEYNASHRLKKKKITIVVLAIVCLLALAFYVGYTKALASPSEEGVLNGQYIPGNSNGSDPIATAWTAAGPSTKQNQFDSLIVNLSLAYGLPNPMAVKAEVDYESGFNAMSVGTCCVCSNALTGSSGSSAYGLLQSVPACSLSYGTFTTPYGSKYPSSYDKFAVCVKLGSCKTYFINKETNTSSPYWSFSVFNPAYALKEGIGFLAASYHSYLAHGCSVDASYRMAVSAYGNGRSTINVSSCTYVDQNNYVGNVVERYNGFVANSLGGFNYSFP
jgi:hypothetical protein